MLARVDDIIYDRLPADVRPLPLHQSLATFDKLFDFDMEKDLTFGYEVAGRMINPLSSKITSGPCLPGRGSERKSLVIATFTVIVVGQILPPASGG